MRGLIIREPWIDLILGGHKTWEMRSRRTKIRGRVGLIRKGSSLVLGAAEIVDSRPPLTRDNFMAHRDKHAIPESMLDEVLKRGWTYPWVLAAVERFSTPVPYVYAGGVTFVTLDKHAAINIQESSGHLLSDGTAASLSETMASWSSTEFPFTAVEKNECIHSSIFDDELVFRFAPERAQAYGLPADDGGFLVLADSTAMRNGSPAEKRDRALRDDLVQSGVLALDSNPALYRFTRDYRFSSPSQSAGVIKDGNASGPQLWKEIRTGMTLKAHLDSSRERRAS